MVRGGRRFRKLERGSVEPQRQDWASVRTNLAHAIFHADVHRPSDCSDLLQSLKSAPRNTKPQSCYSFLRVSRRCGSIEPRSEPGRRGRRDVHQLPGSPATKGGGYQVFVSQLLERGRCPRGCSRLLRVASLSCWRDRRPKCRRRARWRCTGIFRRAISRGPRAACPL